MESQREIDARGPNCPLPILHTKETFADIQSGDALKILATDSGATRDFQAPARQIGNGLLEYDEHDKVFTFCMRRRRSGSTFSENGAIRPNRVAPF